MIDNNQLQWHRTSQNITKIAEFLRILHLYKLHTRFGRLESMLQFLQQWHKIDSSTLHN